MPDITKCTGEGCPLKDKCYRFTCRPDYLQSYFVEVPYKDGDCKHLLDTRIKNTTVHGL